MDIIYFKELYKYNNDDPQFDTKDARLEKIKKVFIRQDPFKYIYDMGDYWEHTIKVEEKVEEEILLAVIFNY